MPPVAGDGEGTHAGAMLMAKPACFRPGYPAFMPESPESRGPVGPAQGSVNRCVAMAHAHDVDRSAAFYARLGFTRRGEVRDAAGIANWAHLVSGQAELMLARASGPIAADQQAVLFYMYSDDIASLRKHLLAGGVPDGGRFGPPHRPALACNAVFDITHPFYMTAGELRVHDLDGYCILIGQLT